MTNSSKLFTFLQRLPSRQTIAAALAIFAPVALVLGRAPADIAISIVAVLFLVDCLARRDWSWARHPWAASALALWAYSVLRACFIPHGLYDIFAAFVWLRYIFFAASLAYWVLPNAAWRKHLLRAIIAATAFLSCDAIFQYLTGADILGHRPISDYDNRLTATFTAPIVGITIASLFAPPLFWLLGQRRVFLSALFGGLCFLAILLSGERMALLLGLAIMAAWLYFLLRAHRKIWPLLIAALAWLGAMLATQPVLFHRQIETTLKIAQHAGASPYGLAWTSALHVGEAYPVFGVGMRQFRTVCTDERFGRLIDAGSGYPRCYVHPHNIYMEWFSEGGLVGLGGFLLFAGVLLGTLAKRLRADGGDLVLWGLGVTLLVRFAPFFTSTSFFNNWSAISFWLYAGWAMSGGITQKSATMKPIGSDITHGRS